MITASVLDILNSMVPALQGAVAQGVLWGIMVSGVYVTFRLLDIVDLTVDGSFAPGGCVCAMLVIKYNVNPVLALLVVTIAGLLAGAITDILRTVFEIPAILAGTLTQIALWSINLRVMDGKNNVPLLKVKTLISNVVDMTRLTQFQASLIVEIVVAILMIVPLYWFFGMEIGSTLHATGNNEDMIRTLGVDTKMAKLLALMTSDGLVGLSGGPVCQSREYADIGIKTGAIVIDLAAIVIGEVLMERLRSFGSRLISVVVDVVVYFLIRAIVLQLRLSASGMKLFPAVLVVLVLSIPMMIGRWKMNRAYSEDGEEEGC